MIKKLVSKTLKGFGYSLERISPVDISRESEFLDIYALCKPFTMTSIERMFALYTAVRYVVDSKTPGNFVECGVWKGGSSMMIAKVLANSNITDRKIYMYDTFEGMSAPGEFDKSIDDETAAQQMKNSSKADQESVWCYAPIDEVRQNMAKTGLPASQTVLVQGMIENTLKAGAHADGISLLRLDTDWYESTRHELEHLYPRLAPNGVLMIDDYGHWQGCRKAVDEYFAAEKINLLLSRVDYTGRMAIKPA